VAIALMVMACAGDDDASASADEDAYVSALASRWDNEEGNQFTPAENRCAAEAYLDVIGLAPLRRAVSPDEIGDSPEKNLVDFGVEIDEEQARSIYEGTRGCGDLRAAFLSDVAQALGDMSVAEVDEACLDQGLDNDRLETFVLEQLQRGQSGPRSRRTPQMAEAYVDWVGECVDLRAALVALLQGAVEDQASPGVLTCLEQQIDDDFARQAWIQLFIGDATSESSDPLTPVIAQCSAPA
jgi:hypothetical protein